MGSVWGWQAHAVQHAGEQWHGAACMSEHEARTMLEGRGAGVCLVSWRQ